MMTSKPLHYINRINKALLYIENHLEDDIRIADLAEAAHFSSFHFQRIFRSLRGESPYEAILRLRLEKSVFLLKHHSRLKIADLAVQCGFPSAENFSRQFKSRFGFSPSAFRKDKSLQKSRIYQEAQKEDFYLAYEESRKMAVGNFTVIIEPLEALPIARVRAVFGADGSGLVEAYQKLVDWADQQKLPYQGSGRRFGMSVDDPEVTPVGKYRYDFALLLDRSLELPPWIEKSEVPGGLYATLEIQGKLTDVAQAWDHLYKVWLPESGYLPRHFPAIEEFIRGPEEIGWDNFDMKCRVPVQKMNDYA